MLIKIAWRNIWRNKRRSLITMASVAFALFFALIMRSMQLGTYDQAYASVINATTGYLQIQAPGYWEKQSLEKSILQSDSLQAKLLQNAQVRALLPRLESFGLLASAESETRPGFLRGIDQELEFEYFKLHEKIVAGSFPTPEQSAVVLAEKLAENLALKVGDSLVIIGQGYQGMSANGKFLISGIADLKNPEANKSTVYLKLTDLQELTGAYQRLSALVVVPENKNDLSALKQSLQSQLDAQDYAVLIWRDMMPELIQAMEADSAGGLAMLFILYLVIGFGVFGTILMLTSERMREFGILISLGMSRFQLALTTFMETSFLGLLGVLSGSLLALPINWYYHVNPIQLGDGMDQMMEDYGMEPIIPFSLDPSIWLNNGGAILLICLILSFYAVASIYRLQPVKAMRQWKSYWKLPGAISGATN